MLEYKRRQEEELTKRMLEERNREKAEEKAARERIRQQIAMVNDRAGRRLHAARSLVRALSLTRATGVLKGHVFSFGDALKQSALFGILWSCIVTIHVFGVYIAFPMYRMKLLFSHSR